MAIYFQGFGKANMEQNIQEELVEFCKHLDQFNTSPVDMKNEFQALALNSLWRMTANQRFDYNSAKLRRLLYLLDLKVTHKVYLQSMD